MSTNKKTSNSQSAQTAFDRIEKLHPYKTFMFFGLVGSAVLFLSMAFLYFVTISRSGSPDGFQLPKLFSVSTVLLMMSSFTISGTVDAFRADSFNRLKIALTGTLLLGVLFCISQAIGWYQMYKAGFFIETNVGVAYLYIITGMHFIHVIGGMIYLISLNISIYTKVGNIAQSLMYFTDNFQLTKLQLTSIYWHFIDALWVLLFFMFLFTF